MSLFYRQRNKKSTTELITIPFDYCHMNLIRLCYLFMVGKFKLTNDTNFHILQCIFMSRGLNNEYHLSLLHIILI